MRGRIMEAIQQRSSGFDGEVSGMSLMDLLQMKAMGRFTGRIAIDRGGQTGLLFFRDGEVVHAELGKLFGKEAFVGIVSWGDGTFRAEPKITTTQQTITESLQFLLLDALRIQDELAAAAAAKQASAGDQQSTEKGGATMLERLSAVAGVKESVLTKRDGTVVQSTGQDADGIAALGLFIVTTSGRIGDELGLGAYKGAVIQGGSSHLLAMEGSQNHLFISLSGDAKTAVAEAEIRKALSTK
jgi:predicted regulator of Ras-like GTPase activity (Roadblock/LC7/MglB family)